MSKSDYHKQTTVRLKNIVLILSYLFRRKSNLLHSQKLDRERLLAEPRGYFRSEARRECTVDALVVGVEPFNLGAVQQVPDDDRGVEMTEGQRLETKPVAEIVLAGIYAKNHVLVTDSELALAVDSRLVTGDHSRDEGLTVEILTELLRPLMDIQVEPDAVAGTVTEIALDIPQRLPGQDVQLAAGSPLREMALERAMWPFSTRV